MKRPSFLLLIVFVAFGLVVFVPEWENSAIESGMQPVSLRLGGTPPPKGTVEVQGKVVDMVGWPLASARVNEVGTGREAFTDAEGRFRLVVDQGASVQLRAEHRGVYGYVTGYAKMLPEVDDLVLVVAPQAASKAGFRTLPPEPVRGEGLVETAEGKTAPHAVITVLETQSQVRANEDGRFKVPLPIDQPVHLWGRSQTGQICSTKVAPSAQQQGLRPLPLLQLKDQGQTLSGYLKDGEGNPAVGVGITLSVAGGMASERTCARVLTGKDGGFQVRGLMNGDYSITALPHRGWVGFRHLVMVGDGQAEGLELSLRAENPLAIFVVDEATVPQAGVEISAEEVGYRTATARTDESGHVILRGLGDGKLVFSAARDQVELKVVSFDSAALRLVVRTPAR